MIASGILQDWVDKSAHDSIKVLEQPKLDSKDNATLKNILIKHNLGTVTPKDYSNVKEIVRKNIPLLQRKQYWLLFSGGVEVLKSTPNLYKETCDDLLGQTHFHYNLEKLATNSHFLTPSGCYSLCKILYVISQLNPNMVYCPMLEPIATVMLHFMSEEDTFACLSGILSKNVLDETKGENIASDCTMQDLLKARDKKIYGRLESFISSHIEGSKLVIFPSLKKMLFDRLPFANLVRIVDCFLIEGPKIFYRVGLYLLTLFYSYSLTFKQLLCSSPQDLVTTIVQYVQSLKIGPELFIKNVLKVKLTSKQISKLKSLNIKMCYAHTLDFTEIIFTHQIVAVDLREVSDIIEPIQWQKLCEWLPDRIQIKKPHLLFTSSNDGYNLKTLYAKCEEEEQTLFIIKTTRGEVFGAYLSCPLLERHFGRQTNSFFGTGETFVFKLLPSPICYHWNMSEDTEHHISRYVFVKKQSLDSEDIPVIKHDESARHSLIRSLSHRYEESLRHSLRRTFSNKSDEHVRNSLRRSFSNKFSHRDSQHDVINFGNKFSRMDSQFSSSQDGLIPLAASVPQNMHFGGDEYSNPLHVEDEIDNSDSFSNKKHYSRLRDDKLEKGEEMKKKGEEMKKKGEEMKKKGEEMKKKGDETPISTRTVLNQARKHLVSHVDSYVIIDDETTNLKCNEVENKMKTGSAELFISCDNNRIVIGGGDGEAIRIDGDIQNGRSTWCQTFCNAPLTSSDHGDFTIQRIDVFGFKEV